MDPYYLTPPPFLQDLTAAIEIRKAFESPTPTFPQGLWEYTYGHKPGVVPGDEFKGRGWLMAAGLHLLYFQGEWKWGLCCGAGCAGVA